MAPDANPFPIHGVRNFHCPHYMGCSRYARVKFYFWSCGQCEYRQISPEVSFEYLNFQMGVDNRMEQHRVKWLDIEEENALYVTPDALQGSDYLSAEEVCEEYISYQMGFANHQGQRRSQSLNSPEATMEYVDYQMGFKSDRAQNRVDLLASEEVLLELFDYHMLIHHGIFNFCNNQASMER